ncbi:HK97 family phage major capsid protein [Lederbergia galactosidilyticus]|uniref:phage major capsid protein n=1 Tax=Lederbergia galactosidilytica TaxID=217031 RepID=UPI001AE9F31C|nr:phage major capsid protein [Lederbergia galactosidilytica]MBP1917190.1 HK97 family phage major capsid protein [Lederbergia galactosidilytica]
MNRKLLLALQKRNKARLEELRGKLEKNEVREEDLESVQTEVDDLTQEQQDIADTLANMPEEGDEGEGEDRSGDDDKDDKDEDDDDEEDEERKKGISQEQRDKVLGAIGKGLSTRGHKSTKTKENEIRSAFANYIVGNIDDKEARSLGLVSGNGAVTVPDFMAKEIITYAQEENFLRRLGTRVTTKENIKYPVLVKKAEAQGHKEERTTDMPETDIEFDVIELEPTEFDALATVTKKLLARTGLPIEQIVMDELKKAYVRKEIQYMTHGNETDNVNDGALSKKAIEFTPTGTVDLTSGQSLYDALVEMKNTPVKEIRKKARWVLNTAALTAIEKMKTDDGFPLLRPLDAPVEGCNYKLLGYLVEEEDAIDGADPSVPVFYFGDFKQFRIQDVIGSLEVQKLVELFSRTNRVGFRIWNLLDAQLVYSPFEPPIYKYEITPDTP